MSRWSPPRGLPSGSFLRRNDLDTAEHRPILGSGEAGPMSGRLPGLKGFLVVRR
jgi:hypothetical protein